MSAIPLAGSLARRWGRTPYVRLRVDPVVLSSVRKPACDASLCRGGCCREGVYAGVRERALILKHAAGIEPLMAGKRNRSPARWFYGSWRDRDVPGGRVCSTRREDGRCAFQQPDGWCVLQRYAVARGLHPWYLKPLNCILYPVVVKGGVLTMEDVFEGRELCRERPAAPHAAVPVVRACRGELTFLLGARGYVELQRRI
jgi:hypothetical protein